MKVERPPYKPSLIASADIAFYPTEDRPATTPLSISVSRALLPSL